MENKTKTTKIKNSVGATLDFPAIRACDNKNLCKSLNFTHKPTLNKEKGTLKINGSNTKKDEEKDLKTEKINKTSGVKTNKPIVRGKFKSFIKWINNKVHIFKEEFFKALKVQHLINRLKNKPYKKAFNFARLQTRLKTIFKTLITRTK